MLEEQGGVCKICKSSPAEDAKKAFSVDHDHSCCPGQKTCGKCIRGIICNACNTALGLLKENVETMQAMQDYVTNFAL
jgi:hypothetical protein